MTIAIQEQDLINIPQVPATKTWNPVHHVKVVDELNSAFESLNLEVANKTYEVSQDGKDMFATWQLLPDNITGVKDVPTVGFRNSMKKRFSLGVVAGHNVLVCSNMCFWGEFQENRKHTNGLTDEVLTSFVQGALTTALKGSNKLREWFAGLNEIALLEDERKILTYDALDSGILTPGHFKKFQAAYAEELKDNGQPGTETLAHFHGAVTRVLRDMSIDNVQTRTRQLNELLMGVGARDDQLLLAA